MKFRKITAAVLAIAAAISLSACSGGVTSSEVSDSSSSVSTQDSTAEASSAETSATDSSQSGEEVSSDDANLTEEEIYDNMIERSLMSTGNLERMSQFITKLKNGEEVTVAFIGGSITEGMTAGPEKCWAKLTYDYLCEKYPDTKINYVNAGMSGTPSVLGNIRLKRDVLDYKPDLVFVEFAVNDGNEQVYKDSYEALVRTVLSQEQQPAVALYFTVIKSGHTCQEYMSKVGEAYGLPMVSLNNALSVEFDAGRMKWEDYSDDESHPNEWGHEMTRDLIVNMLEKVTAEVEQKGEAPISPLSEAWVYSDRFYGMQFVDRTHSSDDFTMISEGSFLSDRNTIAQFPDGWYVKAAPADVTAMEFEFTGKNLMFIYKCYTNERFGSAEFTVDGEKVGSYSTCASDGWNNPVAQLAFSGEEGTHKVSVTLSNEDGKTSYLEILGFAFC